MVCVRKLIIRAKNSSFVGILTAVSSETSRWLPSTQTGYGCSSPPGTVLSVSARGLVPRLHAYPYHHGTVIDSLQKWVDAYTTLMLVLVRAYVGRAVELIKCLQIISRTEAEFKGLTLLNYEEQFRRPAADDLSLNWGLVI